MEDPKNLNVVIEKSTEASIDDRPEFILKSYGIDANYRQEITNSSSNSQFSIHMAFPNSQYGLLDRQVILEQPITIDFTGAGASVQNLLASEYDSLSSFPLTSSMSNINFTFKTQQVSIPIGEIVNPFMWYQDRLDLLRSYGTACTQDRFQSLNEGVNTLNNSLGSVNSMILGGLEPPRGTHPIVVNTNTPTVAQIQTTLREPLFISSLLQDARAEGNNIVGIDSVDLYVAYRQNAHNYIWSRADSTTSNPISTISVTYGVPRVLAKFADATIKERKDIQKVGATFKYPFSYPDVLTSQFPSIASGFTVINRATNSINLKAIPNSLMIWVAPEYNSRIFTDSHNYLSIEGLDINFSSKHSLASASKFQLFNIACSNGYNGDWATWSGEEQALMLGSSAVINRKGAGSVLKLKFGKDIQLPYGQYPGMVGTYYLSANISYKNQSGVTIASPVAYIVPVYDGVLSISQNMAWSNIGMITEKMAQGAKIVDAGYSNGGTFYNGGTIFGDIGSFFKRRILPRTGKIAQHLLEKGAEKGLMALMGLGYSRADAQYLLNQYKNKGKKKKKGKSKAGALVKIPRGRGGKQLTQKQILAHMKKLKY